MAVKELQNPFPGNKEYLFEGGLPNDACRSGTFEYWRYLRMSTIGALGIDQSTPKTQEPPMPKPKTVVTAEGDAKRAWLSFPWDECRDGSRTCSRPDFPLVTVPRRTGLKTLAIPAKGSLFSARERLHRGGVADTAAPYT